MIRLDLAQQHIQQLEAAIADARADLTDWEPAILDAYLLPLVGELDTLRLAVDETLGLERVRSVRTTRTWISIAGGRTGHGRAPATALGSVLGSLQKAVRQLAAFSHAGRTFVSRIPEAIADVAELDVVAVATGSMRVAVAPHHPQLDLDGSTSAESALQLLMEVAKSVEAKAEMDVFEELLPDPILRRQIATRIRELAPSGRKSYSSLEFSGFALRALGGDGSISLSRHAFDEATRYLTARSSETTSYRGQLVAVDIERAVFDLRVDNVRIRCRFGSDLLGTAKQLLQEVVQVNGDATFQLDSDHPTEIMVERVRELTPTECMELDYT